MSDLPTSSTMLVDPWHEAVLLATGHTSGVVKVYNVLSKGRAHMELVLRHHGPVSCLLPLQGWIDSCLLATGVGWKDSCGGNEHGKCRAIIDMLGARAVVAQATTPSEDNSAAPAGGAAGGASNKSVQVYSSTPPQPSCSPTVPTPPFAASTCVKGAVASSLHAASTRP